MAEKTTVKATMLFQSEACLGLLAEKGAYPQENGTGVHVINSMMMNYERKRKVYSQLSEEDIASDDCEKRIMYGNTSTMKNERISWFAFERCCSVLD